MDSDRIQKKRRAEFVTESIGDEFMTNADPDSQRVTLTQREFRSHKNPPTQTDLKELSEAEAELIPEGLSAQSGVQEEEVAGEEQQTVQEEQQPVYNDQPRNYGAFETPPAALLVSTDSPRIDISQVTYFCVGAFVGIALAIVLVVNLSRRRRWACRHRQKRGDLKAWANEIMFHDECDITDVDDFVDPEDHYNSHFHSHPRCPIEDARGSAFANANESNWLDGIGFDDREENENGTNEFGFAEKDDDSESSGCDSDGNDSLCDLLNFDASNSPNVKFTSEPEILPPTVSQLFQNSMSSRWKEKPAPPFEDTNSGWLEELNAQQGFLNKSLFMLNDQLLEQQRELEDAAKILAQKVTRRKHRESLLKHQNIAEAIVRLEGEKDDVSAKLKTVGTKIKAHRMDRRRKLFLNS